MAAVSSLGAGSGLDLEGLLTNLMKVERRPLTVLQNQVTSVNSKISALGSLNSKLSSLQSAAKDLTPALLQSPLQKFVSSTAKFGDEAMGSATVGAGAISGQYNLEVTQLAKAQKVVLDGSSISLNAGDTFTIDIGKVSGSSFATGQDKDGNARSFSVTLDSTNNTLEGLARAINQKSSGVSATVINDGNGGKKLALTGQEGGDQAFQLTSSNGSGFGFNPATGTPLQAAQNAEFKLDGIAVSSTSNTVTDALQGVTLNLKKEGNTTLQVTENYTDKLKTALEGFVKAFNDAANTMKTMGAYDSETKKAGALQGNQVLRNAQAALTDLVFNATGADGMKLSDLGITFKGTDGTLSLDSEKLAAAVASNPEAAANFAAGVGKKFSDRMEGIVGLGGTIKISTDSLNVSIRDLEKRQDTLSVRLEGIEARYRKQFSSLDTLMSQMSSTSNYLAQQLSSLSRMS